MKENSKGNGAYNVVVNGFGYINRIREVAPEGAKPYLACDISLMEGLVNDGDYSNVRQVRMSAIVKGKAAKEAIRNNFTSPDGRVELPAETNVLASVSCGGISPSVFTYQKGEHAGETGVSLRTSLLSIKWMKIGDSVVDLGHAKEQEDATGQVGEESVQADSEPTQPEAAGEAVGNNVPELGFAPAMLEELKSTGRVKLSPTHPEFESRKAFVKEELGLRWSREAQAWMLPA